MIALLLAAALAGFRAEDPGPGRVVLVPRESIADEGLRARVEALLGDAPRLELALARTDAPTDSPPGDGRFPIVARDPVHADRHELAHALREARAVTLSGGPFLDWYETVFPPTGPTRLAGALRRLKREGVHVAAYGPAASFAAGATMIEKSALDRPRRNPRDRHPVTAVIGLALGPPGIVDAEGWPVGDPLELARALWSTKVDFGLFLCGEVALLYETYPQHVRCLGPGAAVVIDLDEARRQKRAIRGGRMSLLFEGDVWNYVSWRVEPAAGGELVARGRAEAGQAPDARRVERFDPRAALEELARDPGRPLTLEVGAYRLLLRTDEATEARRDAAGRPTLVGAAFDLEWE